MHPPTRPTPKTASEILAGAAHAAALALIALPAVFTITLGLGLLVCAVIALFQTLL